MIAGPVADRVGIQTCFILGGLLCLCMGLAGLFIPAVMNMEEKGGTQLEPINAKQTI